MKILVFGLLLLLVVPVHADEGETIEMPFEWGKDPEVEEVDDERAEKMIEALEEFRKSKDDAEIIAALEPFATARHEDFVKALDPFIKHRSDNVRVMATYAMGSQKGKKVGALLFSLLDHRVNKKSVAVRAMTVSALRRAGFDNRRVVDEMIGIFRKQKDEKVMAECARYFGDMKVKHAVKMLIFWWDAPQAANVNSASNPPASYWKRMWEVWDAIKKPVRKALVDITGLEFESKEEWEEWVRSSEAERQGYK